MKAWRFKTKEEFIREGLWVNELGVPKGWSNTKSMNYLLGQELKPLYFNMCEQNRTFKYENKWTISKESYIGIEITEFTQSIPDIIRPEQQYHSQELPEFDLDRLAKEVDELFQEKIKNVVDIHSQLGMEFIIKTEDRIKDYKTRVDSIFRDIKEGLIAEIQHGHTTIVLPDLTEINIQEMDHPEMKNVIISLQHQRKAMLVGPAGTGKTYMVAEIADRLNLPFYKYSCSRDSSVHDLIGYKQPRSETYLETVFLKAYEQGGMFLVDEFDAMSGDMSLFFNGIADASKFISIPHRDTAPIAKKHKDFYLVMCGNTWGKGSVEFSGRDFQDQALMDRFRFCRHFIGYHSALEKQWMGTNYQFATDLRKALEDIGSYLSTRNIEDISNLIRLNISKRTIIDMVNQDNDKEGAKSVNKAMNQY